MNFVRTITFLLLLSATALSAQNSITLEQVRQAALANAPATTDKPLGTAGDITADSPVPRLVTLQATVRF